MSSSHHSDPQQKAKRHTTIEKNKAIQLSRQLAMRLQYARLKVERGWQRQNLNEVENLYFHHSSVKKVAPQPIVRKAPRKQSRRPRQESSASAEGSAGSTTPNQGHAFVPGSPDQPRQAGAPVHERMPTDIGPRPMAAHIGSFPAQPVESTREGLTMMDLLSSYPTRQEESSGSGSVPVASAAHEAQGLAIDPTLMEGLVNEIFRSPGPSHQPYSPKAPGRVTTMTPHSASSSTEGKGMSQPTAPTYDAFWSTHASSTALRSYVDPVGPSMSQSQRE